MEQVEANFNNPGITAGLNRYGFYATEYGIGTFVLFATRYVQQSINEMAAYLKSQNIVFSNEYSEKMWVLRFKINASKTIHEGILTSFSNPAPKQESREEKFTRETRLHGNGDWKKTTAEVIQTNRTIQATINF